jgi:hypothetical protein
MTLSTLTAISGLGLFLLGSLLVPAARGQGHLVQLRVSVFNSSPISPYTIEGAEGKASRILRDAGVAVIWLNCPQDPLRDASFGKCAEVSFPFHLNLRILPSSRDATPSTVGMAFLDENGEGCSADLFYEPVQQLQAESDVPISVILGHAMAHELGHLLLGANAHSLSGLMRAHWSHEDLINMAKGNLRFSHEQSIRITNRLAREEHQGTIAMVGN